MNDRDAWFAPKSYGYGTGLPISWQGWLLLTGFVLIMTLGALFLAPHNMLAYLAIIIPLTAGLIWIAKKTTRGGWRWRWGEEE